MGGSDALRGRFLRPRKRGEPMVMFLMVLMLWAGARFLVWEGPVALIRSGGADLIKPAPLPSPPHGGGGRGRTIRDDRAWAALCDPPQDKVVPVPAPLPIPPALPEDLDRSVALHLPDGPMQDDWVQRAADSAKVRGAVAQQMLYLAVMADFPMPGAGPGRSRRNRGAAGEGGMEGRRHVSSLPLPALTHEGEVNELVVPRQQIAWTKNGAARHARRWSGDGWLLMRQDGGSHALDGNGAPYGPTYGANQIGAVLRYRLIPGEAHKLTAYTRAYAALNGTGEREAAAGFSLRPLPKVPVIALAEMRASQFQSGQIHARPAVSLVTEIPPLSLGNKVEAETYVQAGYVGGAVSTPFIDGQLRVEHVRDHAVGRAQLRVGLGAWGGAQEGANRLDVGPTLRLGLSEGGIGARLAIDYRLRVRGNAMPVSGPALTLSAGF